MVEAGSEVLFCPQVSGPCLHIGRCALNKANLSDTDVQQETADFHAQLKTPQAVLDRLEGVYCQERLEGILGAIHDSPDSDELTKQAALETRMRILE